MAGDWLKVECDTPDKPEVIGIAGMLKIRPAHAFGCLFLVWRWFDKHTTEGNAQFVTSETVDEIAGVTGFADAMVRVRWLCVDDDDSLSLPNFGRHNGETAKQRGLTAKRVAKSKAKSNAVGNANDVTNGVTGALPREEKRREDIKTSPSHPAGAKFAMVATWQPSSHLPDLAKQAGVEIKPEKLGEFIAYWLTQPKTRRTQAEWDKALMQSAKHDKLHAESNPLGNQPTKPRSGGIHDERAKTIAVLTGQSAGGQAGRRSPVTLDAE